MPLLISHDISLLPKTDPPDFERFVREVDYPACGDFEGLLSFTVVRDPRGRGLYRELILVTSTEAFGKAMDSDTFRRLEKEFNALAFVTSETIEEVLGEPYGVACDSASEM